MEKSSHFWDKQKEPKDPSELTYKSKKLEEQNSSKSFDCLDSSSNLLINEKIAKFITWSKLFDSMDSFKQHIEEVCMLLWTDKITLYKLLENDQDKVKVEFVYYLSKNNYSLWDIIPIDKNPNFKNALKKWFSQIWVEWEGDDAAICIWSNNMILWIDQTDSWRVFDKSEKMILKLLGNSIIWAFDAWSMILEKTTDPLTGLLNRKAMDDYIDLWIDVFNEKLPKIWAISFFDIDNFRDFNNTYWHELWDKVLIHVAKVLKKFFGKVNWRVYRYWWEEIVWIVNTWMFSNEKDLYKFLEEIRSYIESSKIYHNWIECFVTVSIWLCSEFNTEDFKNDDTKAKEMIKKADHAMYFWKQNWRNQINIYNNYM